LADTLAYFNEEKEVLYQRFFVAMLLGRKEAHDRKSYRSGKRLNKKFFCLPSGFLAEKVSNYHVKIYQYTLARILKK
jgi:hypothetical protein